MRLDLLCLPQTSSRHTANAGDMMNTAAGILASNQCYTQAKKNREFSVQ